MKKKIIINIALFAVAFTVITYVACQKTPENDSTNKVVKIADVDNPVLTTNITISSSTTVNVSQTVNAVFTSKLSSKFDSLNIDFAAAATYLGLSSLSKNDIDFTNLYLSYINGTTGGKAILAPFKQNSNTDSTNYGFFISFEQASNTFTKPMLVKTVLGKTIQYIDLDYAKGIHLDYNGSVVTFGIFDAVIAQNRGSSAGCGQAVSDCIADAYVNHGWVSVWVSIQSAFLPPTVAAIAYGCVVKNCFVK